MANYGQVTNKVYGEMTNYDIYMMKKQRKQAESRLFDRKTKQPQISYEQYRKKVEMPVKKETRFVQQQPPQRLKNEFTYKEYLMQQLQRDKPQELLSEEEFYERKLSPKSFNEDVFYQDINAKKSKRRYENPSKATRNENKNSKLKKGGKVFIAFYVLIVMAVASILIVMNTSTPFNSQSVDAAGSAEIEQSQVVQPMSVDESQEEENSNWFDELCKSLKK